LVAPPGAGAHPLFGWLGDLHTVECRRRSTRRGLLVCWLPATCKQGVVNAIDSRSYDLDVSKDAVRSFFISAVLNSDLNPLRDRSGQN